MAPPPHLPPPLSGMIGGGLLRGEKESPLPCPARCPCPLPQNLSPSLPLCSCSSPDFIKDFMKCYPRALILALSFQRPVWEGFAAE